MGTCLEKIGHAACGSRDGLQVFANEDGTTSGYCFSCATYIHNPYGEVRQAKDIPKPKGKTEEEVAEELAEIDGYKTVELPHKKLREASLKHFGVKVGVSEEDGKTPTVVCYPYTRDGKVVAYKMKIIENKKMWIVGSFKDVDAFGWEQAIATGARRLIITEGEDDAIAWHRIIEIHAKDEFRDFTTVISLPNGCGCAKSFLTKHGKQITDRFKEIYLSFDMDEPGREAVNEAFKAMPQAKSIDLPSKDANQCLIDGKGKAAYFTLFNATKPKNSRLVYGEDVHEAAKEQANYGELSWPWEHINNDTKGIRYGETIYIGSGTKMGKSELVNTLAAHFIKVHNIKVFMAKPEEVNKHTYKLLASKIAGKKFHDPDIPLDEEAFDEAGKIIEGHVVMIDQWQHLGWSTLKGDILEAIEWGAKAIFIDPITNLTGGLNAAEANIELERVAEDVSVIAKDNNVVVFLFCHLKAPDGTISKEQRHKYYREGKYIGLGNCAHEMGGDIFSNQFAGSRAMMRKCHMMIGLEGNKDPDLPEEIRCIRNLKILEDRAWGVNGVYPLYWNPVTTLFKEV